MTYAGPARNRDEVEAAVELAARIFIPIETSDDRVARKQFLIQDNPYVEPTDIIVLSERGGEIVGTVVLVNRTINCGPASLPVTHVTSVCVAKDVRGRGLSRILMEASLEECRTRGAAMAFLTARRAVDNYYGRFGFWGLSSYSKLTGAVSEPAPSRSLIEIDPARESDLAACSNSFNRTYAYAFGCHDRNEQYWKYLLAKMRYFKVDFLAVRTDGRPVGYIIASGATIHELAIDDDVEPGDVLSAYAAYSCSRTLTVEASLAHPAARGLAGSVVRATRECRYGGHMGVVLDRRQLAAAAELRIQLRGEDAALSPRTEELDGINYAWDGSKASVLAPSGKLDFLVTARLFGALQHSMNRKQSILDPAVPFNLMLGDQV